MRSNRICCEKCNGDGIVTTRDPKDPPGINTYTYCEDCNGNGWLDYVKGLVVLLVPSLLLFQGVAHVLA